MEQIYYSERGGSGLGRMKRSVEEVLVIICGTGVHSHLDPSLPYQFQHGHSAANQIYPTRLSER